MTVKHLTKKRKIAITAIVLGCLVGVTGIVTTSVLLSGKGGLPSTPVIEKPVDPKPDNPKPDPIPDNPKPTVQTMGMPIANVSAANVYLDSELIYFETLNVWQTHQGVDFAAAKGTPVTAVLDGIVEAVSSDPLDGTYVTLKHSENRFTTYKSLEAKTLVKVGDSVKKGTAIGTVGNTMSTEQSQGDHLHFEVLVDNKLVNPNLFITELGGK